MNKLLKVVSIDDAVDSTGVAFKKVGFDSVMKEDGIDVLIHSNARYRNLFAERTLEDESVIKADPLFSKVKVGSLVAGSIERLATTPYPLENRIAHQWTGIVFSTENPTTVANRNLRANGATVIEIDVDGTVMEPTEATTPSLNTTTIKAPVGP